MKGDLRFKKAIEYANLKPNSKVLDLGNCNNILMNYIPFEIDYTSIDIKGKADYIYDLDKGLPKNLEKFDVIFILEVIEYIGNYKKLLSDCKNHLNPNGRIIITTPTNHCFIRSVEPNIMHCFRKDNLRNIANYLDMNYKILGVHFRIPKLNLFIPSKQTFYNDCFLMVLTNKHI
tara:strand:+ start:5318 stop:5842 length:525 start_codon:yes stop_codon:yes gene_type:complete